MKMKKDDNRGFTLIELIVTVSIMAIVVLFTVSTFGSVKKSEVRSAAKRIDSMLGTLRTKSIAKENEYIFKLYKKSNKWHAEIVQEDATTGDKSVVKEYDLKPSINVYAIYEDGTEHEMVDDDAIAIQCSKTNGRYTVHSFDGTEDHVQIKAIKFGKDGSSKTVHLVVLTGKHYVD